VDPKNNKHTIFNKYRGNPIKEMIIEQGSKEITFEPDSIPNTGIKIRESKGFQNL